MGIFLPYSSENGPHTTGPSAKPSTNRLVPRTMTSSPTPNSAAVARVAVLKTLLAKVTQKVRVDKTVVTVHFLACGQF